MHGEDLRRHEALAVHRTFEHLLTPDDLSRVQQWSKQFDLREATGVIAFVTALADRFGYDATVRRDLCYTLYGHLQHPNGMPPAPPPVARPKPPQAPQPAPTVAEPAPAPEPEKADEKRTYPAPVQIFMALADGVSKAVAARGRNAQEDFTDALTDIQRTKQAAGRSEWPERGEDLKSRNPKQLAELFHDLYLALCDALGPVQADRVLQAVVAEVEKHPAAAAFSPKKLL